MSLNHDDFGDIFDPLGGIKDLNKGIIITPLDPDETFSDDPLRMLRAVRFAAKLNFQVASNILDITYAHASTGGIVLTQSTNSIATKFISEASSNI